MLSCQEKDTVQIYTYAEYIQQRGFFQNSASMQLEEKGNIPGVAGEIVPYKAQGDSLVTSGMLLVFFLLMFIVARSVKTIFLQLKYIFQERDRTQTVMLNKESSIRHQLVAECIICYLYGLSAFYIMHQFMPELFYHHSSYEIIGINWLICMAVWWGKKVLYGIVNWTFFDSQPCQQWKQIYNFLVLLQTISLYVVTLFMVYDEVSTTKIIYALVIVLFCFQMLVIFKAKQIFFGYKFGVIHLFLYLCTLECMPLIFLGHLLINIHGIAIVQI